MTLVVLMALNLFCPGCCGRAGETMGSFRETNIEEVMQRHTDRLMAIPGGIGVAQGLCHGRPGIKVLVDQETPALEIAIPEKLEGVPVCLQSVGEVRAFPEDGMDLPNKE